MTVQRVSDRRSGSRRERTSTPIFAFVRGLLREYAVAVAVFAGVMVVAFIAFG